MAYPVPPRDLPDEKDHRRRMAACLGGVMQGRTNNTGEVTLSAGVSSTSIADSRIAVGCALLLMPETANAAAALTGIHIATANGSAVISHANNSQTDRTFRFVIVG